MAVRGGSLFNGFLVDRWGWRYQKGKGNSAIYLKVLTFCLSSHSNSCHKITFISLPREARYFSFQVFVNAVLIIIMFCIEYVFADYCVENRPYLDPIVFGWALKGLELFLEKVRS